MSRALPEWPTPVGEALNVRDPPQALTAALADRYRI